MSYPAHVHIAFTKTTKMTNRLEVLDMIHSVMTRIRNAASREHRFTLVENAHILAGILDEVTMYEKNLLMDLDVD
jgi:ribosomal protein S8